MAIYKIHPAIGVARVGNSPDEFFIGPEQPGELVRLPGGFKDAQCRVKRQAARFYIFDVTGAPFDATATIAAASDITWSVTPRPKQSGTLDPAHIVGRLQRQEFQGHYSGSVDIPIGELRSDNEGRLIVLGGFGAAGSGWSYDDIWESLLTATFTLAGTPHTLHAWVLVAPPRFRQHVSTSSPMYTALIQAATALGRPVPVVGPGFTPHGLDQAHLEHITVDNEVPGLEVRQTLIADYATLFDATDAVRIAGTPSHALLSNLMASPWQSDLGCGWGLWTYGPGPGGTVTAGINSPDDMRAHWSDIGFVVEQNGAFVETERCNSTDYITLLTPELNFGAVPVGPTGPGSALRAVVFEVRTSAPITISYAPGATPPAPFSAEAPGLGGDPLNVNIGATGANSVLARFWIRYTTATAQPLAPSVTFQQGTQTWTVPLNASTTGRLVTATALVLDRSGSMSELGSDHQPKHDALVEAAKAYVELSLDGDYLQLVSFDDVAEEVPSATVGTVSGSHPSLIDAGSKTTFKNLIDTGFTPRNATSIGNGISVGNTRINMPSVVADQRAILVLTDGVENASLYVADVAPSVSARTYAIGLGTPQNTSAPVLQALTGNSGGYLLITGVPTASDRFLLDKFFAQISAGINGAEVVLDPSGELTPGREVAIPFSISDADTGCEVILFAQPATAVDFRLLSPGGEMIEPWVSAVDPTIYFSVSARLAFYRFSLPAERRVGRLDQGGTWQALLKIGKPQLEPPSSDERRGAQQPTRSHYLASRRLQALAVAQGVPTRGRLPFSLVVHAYSTISLQATFEQSSFEPGAEVTITATLLESNVLPLKPERISVEITRPDGSMLELQLHSIAHDEYQAKFVTRTAGVYRCRVRARGKDRQGYPFTRERTLTAAVWYGGDRERSNPLRSGSESPGGMGIVCEILKCLERDSPELAKRLQDLGIDWASLRRCLLARCREHASPLEVARAIEVELGRARAARAGVGRASSDSPAGYTTAAAPAAPSAADPSAAAPTAGPAPDRKGNCGC